MFKKRKVLAEKAKPIPVRSASDDEGVSGAEAVDIEDLKVLQKERKRLTGKRGIMGTASEDVRSPPEDDDKDGDGKVAGEGFGLQHNKRTSAMLAKIAGKGWTELEQHIKEMGGEDAEGLQEFLEKELTKRGYAADEEDQQTKDKKAALDSHRRQLLETYELSQAALDMDGALASNDTKQQWITGLAEVPLSMDTVLDTVKETEIVLRKRALNEVAKTEMKNKFQRSKEWRQNAKAVVRGVRTEEGNRRMMDGAPGDAFDLMLTGRDEQDRIKIQSMKAVLKK